MQFSYVLTITPDQTGGVSTFLVTCDEVEELATEGASRDEALANAADALEVALLARMDRGEDLPATGTARRGRHLATAQPTAQASAKLALYAAWRAAGISKTELANRLGKSENEVRRLLNPYHATKLSALEAALAALGQRLVVTTEAA